MSLSGPSRTITVEPIEAPDEAPEAPVETPTPEPETQPAGDQGAHDRPRAPGLAAGDLNARRRPPLRTGGTPHEPGGEVSSRQRPRQ